MSTSKSPPLDEYEELIRTPFEGSDERSFALMQKILAAHSTPANNICSFLIEFFTGITITAKDAKGHWKKAINHKRSLESRLGRTVGIKVTLLDYFDQLGVSIEAAPSAAADTAIGQQPVLCTEPSNSPKPEKKGAISSAPVKQPPVVETAKGGDFERLKEEMLRARRYKHAL